MSLTATSDLAPLAMQAMVDSAETYAAAGEMLMALGELRAGITKRHAAAIAAANKAHKEALAARNHDTDPLEAAEKHLRAKMTAWSTAERERALLDAQLLEAQRAAEDTELARTRAEEIVAGREMEAEAHGQCVGDFAAAVEQETAIQLATMAPVAVMPPAVKKLDGLHSRTYWRAEVIDLRALVRAVAEDKVPLFAVVADMSYVLAQARQQRALMAWPGVRVWAENVPVRKGA